MDVARLGAAQRALLPPGVAASELQRAGHLALDVSVGTTLGPDAAKHMAAQARRFPVRARWHGWLASLLFSGGWVHGRSLQEAKHMAAHTRRFPVRAGMGLTARLLLSWTQRGGGCTFSQASSPAAVVGAADTGGASRCV